MFGVTVGRQGTDYLKTNVFTRINPFAIVQLLPSESTGEITASDAIDVVVTHSNKRTNETDDSEYDTVGGIL